MQQILSTSLFILFVFVCGTSAIATEAEAFKTQLQTIAEKPFDGKTPEQYKSFSQQQGSALIDTADKMLALPKLSPEDKSYALLMKYWGLVRKYGFDPNERDQQFDKFAHSIEEVPGMIDLYQTIMLNLYRQSHTTVQDIDEPKEKAEAFIKHRDRFLPYMNKYCTEDDDRQFVVYMGQLVERCDPDASFGLVESTVEMMMPLLKEQEKSPETKSTSLMMQGRGQRVQLTGNAMKYEGVSTHGDMIDVTDYRGKVVFLNFEFLRTDTAIAIHKKLYDTLHSQGLVMITHDPMVSREVARKKAEDAGIPWIITCRMAHREKNLEDYYQKWGLTSALFLVDREGKVIHSWANGFCPAACDTLKKLFPERENIIEEIRAEVVQKEADEKRKRAKMVEKGPNPLANEMMEMLKFTQDSVQSYDRESSLVPLSIYSLAVFDLADILRSIPDTSKEEWGWAARIKLETLQELACQQLEDHPEMNPAETFKRWEQEIEDFERSTRADMFPLFHYKVDLILEMIPAYLGRETDSRADYAREIYKRWVAINREEIARIRSLPKEQQNVYLLAHYNRMIPDRLIDAMSNIDEDGSQGLVASLCDDLAPVLENSGFYELQEIATRLQGVSRRYAIGKEFEFECLLLDGTEINVADLRGKIVLVNFWATWCGPCLMELPNMKTQYEKYKDKGYEMIAMSTEAEIEKIVEFQNTHQYPWLVSSLVQSKEAGLKDYHAYYGIQGIPETFLLDREGKVLFRMTGSDDESLNRELVKAFGE